MHVKIRIYCPGILEQFYQKPISRWCFSAINHTAEIYQWTPGGDKWEQRKEGHHRIFSLYHDLSLAEIHLLLYTNDFFFPYSLVLPFWGLSKIKWKLHKTQAFRNHENRDNLKTTDAKTATPLSLFPSLLSFFLFSVLHFPQTKKLF